MTESEFHRLTPSQMEELKAAMACAVCGAARGECDCWIDCECGWKYYKDNSSCKNPDCKKG